MPTIYDNIFLFGEYKKDWAKVQIGDLLGFISYETGKEIVSVKYREIEKFGLRKKNWALVKYNSLYGFIDDTGKEIIPPSFESITPIDQLNKQKNDKK